jgi:Rrf2 family transcriptional regulator, repressor of oqxAB
MIVTFKIGGGNAMVDLRFASALQMMLSLAYAAELGEPVVASAQLAEGLGANPSLVRKLISPLVLAGLITTTKGKLGGMQLGRMSADITLADIYLAVVSNKKMFAHREDIVHRCPVTSNIDRIFSEVSAGVEDAVLQSLTSRTLEYYMQEISRPPSVSRRTSVRRKSS